MCLEIVFVAFAIDNLNTAARKRYCDRKNVCSAPIYKLQQGNEFFVFRTLILYLSNGRFSGVEPRYTVCKEGLEVTGPTRGVETTLRRSPQTPFDTCIFAFMIQTSNLAFPSISKFALTNS